MSGFGDGPFGTVPFGAGASDSTPTPAGPPRGRVYAKVAPSAGTATLEASRSGKATLAASPQAFAKLSPSAGFSTLQTD